VHIQSSSRLLLLSAVLASAVLLMSLSLSADVSTAVHQRSGRRNPRKSRVTARFPQSTGKLPIKPRKYQSFGKPRNKETIEFLISSVGKNSKTDSIELSKFGTLII